LDYFGKEMKRNHSIILGFLISTIGALVLTASPTLSPFPLEDILSRESQAAHFLNALLRSINQQSF
jgi:hypothetical protein